MTVPLVSLFVFVISGPPLLGAAEGTRERAIDTRKAFLESQDSAVVGASHPAVGIWKGTARGSGLFVPKEGIPIRFWVQEKGEGLDVAFTIQGFDRQGAPGTYTPETRMLSFRGSAPNGIPILFELELEGESAKGHAKSIGLRIGLELERFSRDILAEKPAPNAPVDPDTLTLDDWRADLDYLREYLPQVHMDAFHKLTRRDWNAAIDDLRAGLDDYDAAQLAVAMAQVVARIGDAHTGLHWRETGGFHTFPVHVLVFEDGVHVVAVDERYGEALCARIVRIGGHPTDEVISAVASVFSAENEHWKKAQAPTLIIVPKLLHLLGLIDSPERLPLELELDGDRFGLVVQRSGSGEWLHAPDARFERIPRWRQNQGQRYWLETLSNQKALYFAYNSCADDPKKPMAQFIDELITTYEADGAERLIIDLRNNSGGNSTILGQHVRRLAQHESIAGRIFCLIGPQTYSSGMLNANQLRHEAGAMLLGEPTGGKPNSFGEVRSFRLPHSGFKVFYSTKYFRLLADEDPPAVAPDLAIGLTAEEFYAGEDPVLEAALEAQAPR